MKSVILTAFVTSALFASHAAVAVDAECVDWFIRSGLKTGKGCLGKCVIAEVGMGTFDCIEQCEELCKPSSIESSVLGRFAYYPGLTEAERKLVKEDPITAWKVYKAKGRAEEATFKRFKRNMARDESDAFRHFVWAGILRWEIGLEKARLFTEAHENAPFNPSDERAMDLANNRAGMLAAEELENAGKKMQSALEERALEELRTNRLVVLEKRGMPKK